MSSDIAAVEPFQEELKKVMADKGYSRDQIFNADETGLWWRMTPSCSLNASGIAKAANFKKSKERVTLMGCSNASGSFRLPLVFINKSKKPRCFKNMDMNQLPVKYYAQAKSWMDCKIFSDWFHQHFVPLVNKFCGDHGMEKKALLLLDNAPSHPSAETLQSDDRMIKTMFLPPNTTAAIQPMDQGVLDPCKRRYKRKLLAHIILENESEDKSVPEILKACNMKQVVYWIASAWEEASADSLRKAWNKLLPESDTDDDNSTEDGEGNDLSVTDMVRSAFDEATGDVVAEWMEADVDEPGHEILNDDEIVVDIVDGANDVREDSSDEEDSVDEPKVSPGEAFSALDVSLRWLEQSHADPCHLLLVKKWRDEAAKIRFNTMKQSNLFSYFKRQSN